MNKRIYKVEDFEKAAKEFTINFIPPKAVEHITINFTVDKFPDWFLTPNEELKSIIMDLRKEIEAKETKDFTQAVLTQTKSF